MERANRRRLVLTEEADMAPAHHETSALVHHRDAILHDHAFHVQALKVQFGAASISHNNNAMAKSEHMERSVVKS